MGCCLEVVPAAVWFTPDGVRVPATAELAANRPVKSLDLSDRLELERLSGKASLLILSQKYHRDWKAKVLVASGWMDAQTVPVNGVFQGVLLPDGAQKLRLAFLPFARFAWVAHVFWMLVLILLANQYLRARFRASPAIEGMSLK
jgi:hypothetical protein